MINKQIGNKVTWIDLESPTAEEVKQVVNEYKIHPLVAHELSAPTIRPKVDLYNNFIYLILHFPGSRVSDADKSEQEIDFIIGKDFLITTRYAPMDAIHSFSRGFEVSSILAKGIAEDHAGYIFLKMLGEIYTSLLQQLDGLKEEAKDIENNIFKGHEKAMVFQISKVSRSLLSFRRSTSMHKEVLESFEVAADKFFGGDFRFYVHGLLGEQFRVDRSITGMSEFVSELRETNNSLLNTRETEAMKMLTVVAFLTLPTAVITSFFQMATKYTPILGMKNDWLLVSGIVLVTTIFFIVLGKLKKWF